MQSYHKLVWTGFILKFNYCLYQLYSFFTMQYDIFYKKREIMKLLFRVPIHPGVPIHPSLRYVYVYVPKVVRERRLKRCTICHLARS